MDIKIDGLTQEIMRRALAQAREGRLHILGKMLEALPAARAEDLAVRAAHHDDQDQSGQDPRRHRPRWQGDQRIIEETGAKIDIEDDGTIKIASVNATRASARKRIDDITAEVEVGRIYEGTVLRFWTSARSSRCCRGRTGSCTSRRSRTSA